MRLSWFLGASASALLISSAVQAQTAPPPDTTGPGGVQLQEVIVQARRINELQQQVPVAVTTLDKDVIRNETVTSVDQLQNFVPNFQVYPGSIGGNADPAFTLRGLTGAVLTDPAVVSYFDEVVQDPRNFAYSMYDLGSVQVLKGPQGTLFGKNSTGGAVLFQPVRPGPDLGGFIDGRYGAFNDRELTGALNIPISQTLQLRVSGDIDRRDGTIKSIPGDFAYDNRNHESARFEIQWRPSDSFENYLQGSIYKVRELNPQPLITAVAPCTNPFASPPATQCLFQPPLSFFLGTTDITQALAQQQAAGINHSVNDARDPFNVDYAGVTDIAQLHFTGMTLKNIAHYDYAHYDIGFDIDGTTAPILDEEDVEHNHFWSDELQLLGTGFGDRLNWLVGGYASELMQNQFELAHQVDVPGVNPLNPLLITDHVPQRSTAVFGQATFNASDWIHGLSFTAGYRYTWDHKAFTDQRLEGRPPVICGLGSFNPLTGTFDFFPGVDPATCTRSLAARYANDNYDFSVNWQATDKLLVYVATRKGYKAGGFNFSASEPQFTSYAPETLRDVELGLKSDWRLGEIPLRFNAAIFRSNYQNIQSQVTRIDPATGNIQSLIINDDPATGAPNRAILEGGEAELTLIPTRGLTLSAFYGYTRGHYEQFTDNSNPLMPVNLAGQPVSGLAKQTAGVTLNYAFAAPSGWGEPVFTASFYGRSKLTTNILDLQPSLPGYTNLDLRFDWREIGGRPIDIGVYGDNVTNRRYVTNGLDVLDTVGFSSAQYNEPATYGVEVRYHFGG